MANKCTEDKTIGKDGTALLNAIPILRYPKEPVVYIDDLYKKYPQGGEYGWYAFVMTAATFAYWDVHSKDWKLLSAGDLQTILGADAEELKEGDVPVWDAELGKFVIVNSNLWGDVEW